MQKIYIGVVDGKVVLIQGIYDSDFETHQQANPSITFIENTFGLTEVDGYLYDAKKKTVKRDPDWTPPAPPPELVLAPPSRHIAAGALYLRFTFAERAAILLAGTVNPAADAKTQQLQAQVATLRADLLSSRTIDLDGAGLATGLGMLASLKVLDADWKDRVQLAPITDAERQFGQS